MSIAVYIGRPPLPASQPGAWSHFGGGNITRVADYPGTRPVPFAGVAGTTATAANELTLPDPTDTLLLDQWLKISEWHVVIHVDSPASGITSGYVYDGQFDVVTGANASIVYDGNSANFVESFSTTTAVDQEKLKLGGVVTRIEFEDPDHEMVGTPYPDPLGTTEATTNRKFSLAIRHGDWAWHGPLAKWCAGVTLTLEWSVIDEPVVTYNELLIVNQPDDPAIHDACTVFGSYHWDGIPGQNLGNETHPLWTYNCVIDAFSKIESVDGWIDPDMERADALDINPDDYFQIGTFLGRPMYVRMDRVVGDEKWDAWQSAQNTTIDITATAYYP